MRIAIGCLSLWVATACASGARAQDAPLLSRDDRIDLLNAVLDARAELFGQPVHLFACDLTRDLDLGPDFVTRIDQRWRGRLWGGLAPWCPRELPAPPATEVYEAGAVVLHVQRLSRVGDEYYRARFGESSGYDSLAVVRIHVAMPRQGSRVEEYVLRLARPSVWAVVGVSVFAFGYAG